MVVVLAHCGLQSVSVESMQVIFGSSQGFSGRGVGFPRSLSGYYPGSHINSPRCLLSEGRWGGVPALG